jgi:fucose 4-O-acetylase-like acetyltransferase
MMIIPEITLLRAIGIILVVLGHSDIGGQIAPDYYPFVEKFVYSFHMPLFVFISGFVFMYTNYDKISFNYAHFINKKVTRLFVPSSIVLSIAFILRAILSHLKNKDEELYTIVNYFKMFILKDFLPIEFFWYMFTLFLIFMLSKLLIYFMKKNNLSILVLSVLFITMNLFPIDIEIFYITYLFGYLIYFWSGCIFFLFVFERKLFAIRNDGKFSFVLSISLLTLLIYLNLIENNTNIGGLVCAFSGITVAYFIARYLNRFKLSYLRSIGEYSYQIFLLSWFFHRIVETIGFQKLKLSFWVTFPVSFLLAILGPLIVTKIIITKTPKLKFAIGLK